MQGLISTSTLHQAVVGELYTKLCGRALYKQRTAEMLLNPSNAWVQHPGEAKKAFTMCAHHTKVGKLAKLHCRLRRHSMMDITWSRLRRTTCCHTFRSSSILTGLIRKSTAPCVTPRRTTFVSPFDDITAFTKSGCPRLAQENRANVNYTWLREQYNWSAQHWVWNPQVDACRSIQKLAHYCVNLEPTSACCSA